MSDDAERKLTPANENPWYWLATIYGEQAEGAERRKYHENPWKYHEDLAARNRKAWNRWMTAALSDEQRADLIKKGVDRSEFGPLPIEERDEFLRIFVERAGRSDVMPPDPMTTIDFHQVHFEHYVCFTGFVFPSPANFLEAAFSGRAEFRKTTFIGYADLRGVAFSGFADFRGATFSGYASFVSASFFGHSDFGDATFSDWAGFIAEFEYSAGFMGSTFNSHTVFAGAKFKTRVPDFRDAKLREATEWHGATWPPSPKDREAAQQQVYAYERLKLEMERLKKHADEQFFFAEELRARRALETRWSLQWLLNYAYDISSGYGQSVGWPLFWLVVLFAVCADFFALAPVHGGASLTYDVAAALSATNLFALLPYKPKLDDLSTLAQIIGDVQAVLGVVLLFLLGLALRNRFRMK